jgi:putative ABC transport system substrate-binding protein
VRRRDFLGLTGAVGAAAFQRVAFAQQPRKRPDGRLPLIAALVNATKAQSDIDTLGPFAKGLADLGYVQDRDFTLAAFYDNGDVTLQPAFAKQLVALSPEVIVVSTGNATPIVAAATKTIPILSPAISVGVIPTLVGTLARPSGNVTGF